MVKKNKQDKKVQCHNCYLIRGPVYKTTCVHCDETIKLYKSIGHRIGAFESGWVSCPNCKEGQRVIYNPKDDSMTTKSIEEL